MFVMLSFHESGALVSAVTWRTKELDLLVKLSSKEKKSKQKTKSMNRRDDKKT